MIQLRQVNSVHVPLISHNPLINNNSVRLITCIMLSIPPTTTPHPPRMQSARCSMYHLTNISPLKSPYAVYNEVVICASLL